MSDPQPPTTDAPATPARPTPEFPFTFHCQRSGNCCARPGGVVRVNDNEAARLAAHLGLSTAGFRSRYLAASGDRLRDGLGPGCIFLQQGTPAACAVYDARPDQCREWPHWEELRDPARVRAAQRFCPGIQARPAAPL
ncbi:MAG: YkgJ family cysteine cluster protein [Planctomycetota bacterium]